MQQKEDVTMPNIQQDLKTLLSCQKQLLELNAKNSYKEIPPDIQKTILSKIKDTEMLLNAALKHSPDKFAQKLTYSQEGFMITQPTVGGNYMLWSGISDNAIQCGIGFDVENSGYIDTDLFVAETKKSIEDNKTDPQKTNKDIDMYIYADPYTENYTDQRQISYADLKEALEID